MKWRYTKNEIKLFNRMHNGKNYQKQKIKNSKNTKNKKK